MTEVETILPPRATPALIQALQGIYVHIPFCVHKCPYCDFASGPAEGRRRKTYLEALSREIETSPWSGASPRTLYFGGGTPSELSIGEWQRLLETLNSSFDLRRLEEFTVECNPGTLSPSKLAAFRASGVNRISLGIQSLNDRLLTQLGRIHDAACARESVELVRDSGFSNLSLDLMFGLPGQTFEEWRNDLQEAIRLAPRHLSLYALTLEPGTPFFELEARKKLPPMDPDRAADMFEYCIDYCSANDYRQYELSNYCREGAESLHNLLYWTNGNYLGLGVSAASHIAGCRWANARNQDRYSGGWQSGEPQLEYVERLSPGRRAAEELILRLRLAQGADLEALSEVHGFSLRDTYSVQLRELTELELVEAQGGRLVLTRKGTLLASEVACYFL